MFKLIVVIFVFQMSSMFSQEHSKDTLFFDLDNKYIKTFEELPSRYYINEKGNAITTGFTKECAYVTDYPAYLRQIPTKYYFKCLEPTTVVRLPYSSIMESYKRFKNSEMQGRLIAEMVLTILNDRVESFLFNTAEERYLKFINENPDLIQRISLTDLSSFLGVERQSLSRIRRKLAKN